MDLKSLFTYFGWLIFWRRLFFISVIIKTYVKYKLMKIIVRVTGSLPLAILLRFTAYLLSWYIKIDIVIIVLLILLVWLDVNQNFLMIDVYMLCLSYFWILFNTQSCGSSYPTLFLMSCRILLILQILYNGFHEVYFLIFQLNLVPRKIKISVRSKRHWMVSISLKTLIIKLLC